MNEFIDTGEAQVKQEPAAQPNIQALNENLQKQRDILLAEDQDQIAEEDFIETTKAKADKLILRDQSQASNVHLQGVYEETNMCETTRLLHRNTDVTFNYAAQNANQWDVQTNFYRGSEQSASQNSSQSSASASVDFDGGDDEDHNAAQGGQSGQGLPSSDIQSLQHQQNQLYQAHLQRVGAEDRPAGLPHWMHAEKLSFGEIMEIRMYKCITLIPVLITFGVFIFLFTFYTFFYLYPMWIGDFYGTWGIRDMWKSEEELEASKTSTRYLAVFFGFCVFNLLISMVLTMSVGPGYIPEDREWDMPSDEDKSEAPADAISNIGRARNLEDEVDSKSGEANQRRRQDSGEELINNEIQQDIEDPRETQQLDYIYLKSKTGPMYQPRRRQEDEDILMPGAEADSPQVDTRQRQSHQAIEQARQLLKTSIERKHLGGVRMCQRCLRTKPDRCHHCSQCNRCILKMDHHCPWVSNCIGFNNYKYFMNLLFYCSVTCQTMIWTSNHLFQTVLHREDVAYRTAFFIVTAYVLACFFGFIITFFFLFHMWLISQQYTTIEFCEKRGNNELFKIGSPYDLGCFKNIQKTLGNNPLTWFLPCCRNMEGGGLFFEVMPEVRQKLAEQLAEKKQKAQLTARSRED